MRTSGGGGAVARAHRLLCGRSRAAEVVGWPLRLRQLRLLRKHERRDQLHEEQPVLPEPVLRRAGEARRQRVEERGELGEVGRAPAARGDVSPI